MKSRNPNFGEAVVTNLPSSSQWILDWVRRNYNPEDVFSIDDLVAWAEENGFTKPGLDFKEGHLE